MTRRAATTPVELERVALDLFVRDGFAETTVDDIAAAAGISRRTFFRYYASKNDVVWGQFEVLLGAMADWLGEVDDDVPLLDALAAAVVRFNSLPTEAIPAHRRRMALILHVPALQAHSTVRYADWRAVVARFVARRLDLDEADPAPQLAGHVTLALAVAAYEQWLADETSDLAALLESNFAAVDLHLA